MMKRTALRSVRAHPGRAACSRPHRLERSSRPRTLEDPATGETVPRRSVLRHLASGHRDDDLQRGARHPRLGYRFQARPRPDRPARSGKCARSSRASKRNKFRFEYIPIKFEQESVLDARRRVPGSAVSRRRAGQLPTRLEGVPFRLRVRFHLAQSRLRRNRARGEVHRGHRRLAEPDQSAKPVKAQSADSGHRRHRSRLHRARTSRSPAN